MFSQLMKITDMADRAAAGRWRVNALARNCGVSVPTLERFFEETKGQCPREWIIEERMRRARASLEAGRNVQQTADDLVFKNQHHFSAVFKKCHSYCPKEHKARMEALKKKKKKIEDGRLKMARSPSPPRFPSPHRMGEKVAQPDEVCLGEPGEGLDHVSSVPNSAVRSPQSAVRSPQSAVRSPQSATMMPGVESVFDKIKPNLVWFQQSYVPL